MPLDAELGVQAGTSVQTLIATADNGASNIGNAASLNAQIAALIAEGIWAARLPGASNAYGLEVTLQIPPGFLLVGDGSLSFRNPKTGTALTAGKYTGTAFVPSVGWVDPGFDIRQDMDTSIGGASTVSFTNASSTILDSAIQAGDAGRPVTGYNVTNSQNTQARYVSTVTPGVSFVLVDSTGAPQNPVGSGNAVCVGSNYPVSTAVTGTQPTVGGLVCLAGNGNQTGSGGGLSGVTVNSTNVNGTTRALVGLWMAGSGGYVKDCLFIDGLVSSFATTPGTSTGSSQDSRFIDCSFVNTIQFPVVTLTGNSAGAVTGTTGSRLLSGITTSLTPVAAWPQALAGAANPTGGVGYWNGAAVQGKGIPAGTFIAPGGINANGPGTLLLSSPVAAGFTGLDVTIIQPDRVGLAAQFSSTDCYLTNPHVVKGTVGITAGDLVVLGGNIFGAASTPVALDPTAITAATSTNDGGSPNSTVTVTVTVASTTGLSTGQTVSVAGLTGTNWAAANGIFTATVISATQFTYTFSVAQASVPSATATVTGTVTAAWTFASAPDVYVFGTGGTDEGAVQFTGTTFGPGPGHGFGSYIRRDSGVVTVTGGLLEQNNLSWNAPCFEDNDPSTTLGFFNVAGTTVKKATTTVGLGAICYRRDGNSNPRSTFSLNLASTALAAGAPLWCGGGVGPTFSGAGGTPGVAQVNNAGTITTVGLGGLTSTEGFVQMVSNTALPAGAATQVTATPSLAPGTYWMSASVYVNGQTSTGHYDVYLASATAGGATLSGAAIGTTARLTSGDEKAMVVSGPVTVTAAGEVGLFVEPVAGMTGSPTAIASNQSGAPAYKVTQIAWTRIA